MFWTIFLLSRLLSFLVNDHNSAYSSTTTFLPFQVIDSIAQPRFVCDRMADSLELVKFYNALGGPNWNIKWNLIDPISTWYGVFLNSEGCVECMSPGNTCGSSLESNNLNGTLIDLNLPFLQTLIINETQYTDGTKFIIGEIPDFSKLPNLKTLRLWGSFTGAIPDFSNLDSLNFLELVGYFDKQIPDFRNLTLLESLSITGVFVDTIPDFHHLPKLKDLKIFGQYNGTTTFNGQIVSAPYSNLIGLIPDFSSMPNLGVLDLIGISCTGNIPNFKYITNLGALGISECYNLTGDLPDFNKLNELVFLRIGYCSLSGLMPSFNNLPKLILFDIYQTNISGAGPLLANSKKIISVYLVKNKLKYLIPKYNHLVNLRSLDFAENNLTFEDMIQSFMINKLIIENNATTMSDTLIYSPQGRVFLDTLIYVYENDVLKIDLKIDDTISTNVYYWLKDSLPFDTIFGSNKLIFNSIQSQDAGIYTVQITNPNAPDLTLYSYPIEIQVISCSRPTTLNDNIELDENTLSTNIDPLENDDLPNDVGNYQVELLTVPVKFNILQTGSHNFLIQALGDSISYDEQLEYLVCDTTCQNACDTGFINVKWTAPEPGYQKTILLTPNGDHVNDILVIEGIEAFPNNELLIVNRWGNVVYKAKPYMNNWGGEGTDGSLLTQGTYYYILRNVGSQLPQGGDIVILK